MRFGGVLGKFLWVGLTAFGAARWVNLENAFVRTGAIREEDFMRDLAIAQTLPGPGFVNLTALCGMRLGGPRTAFLAIVLVLLPGLVAVTAVLAFLSMSEPWVARLFQGILVGAVGVLAASFVRMTRRLQRSFDALLTAATLILIVAGTPMVAAVLIVGGIGVLRYRWSRLTLP
ncbi:MAG TPA: chromate transporter [Candidatus Limnocylindria bacterium]|nr:chromate transporter [Candidatus Limnocylindria bacterium]